MKKYCLILLVVIFSFNLSAQSGIERGISNFVFKVMVDKSIKRARFVSNDSLNKQIILVPMMHLGTEEHYSDVRKLLDSLKNCGYVTFYETVRPFIYDKERFAKDLVYGDSLLAVQDTLARKFRRVTGLYLGDKGHADNGNKSIKNFNKSRKYISQTNDLLGLTTDRDIWVDYYKNDLIAEYEKECNPIILSKYDWDTPLLDKYIPPIEGEHKGHELLDGFRDAYLLDKILTSEYPKIVVVYGAMHTLWIWSRLITYYGFEEDKRFKAKRYLKKK